MRVINGILFGSAVLAALAFFSSGSSRRIFDAAVLTVFPSRVTLQVAPGNVRIKTGSPLGINARLACAQTPLPYRDARLSTHCPSRPRNDSIAGRLRRWSASANRARHARWQAFRWW